MIAFNNKRIFTFVLFLMLICNAVGCGAGTDVGNPIDPTDPGDPSIPTSSPPPTLEDYIGNYELSVFDQSSCQINETDSAIITLGHSSDEVTIDGFFEYANFNFSFTATISNEGSIFFSETSADSTLECVGRILGNILSFNCSYDNGISSTTCKAYFSQI